MNLGSCYLGSCERISQRGVVDNFKITNYNVVSRIIYEWGTRGETMRLISEILNIEIMQQSSHINVSMQGPIIPPFLGNKIKPAILKDGTHQNIKYITWIPGLVPQNRPHIMLLAQVDVPQGRLNNILKSSHKNGEQTELILPV